MRSLIWRNAARPGGGGGGGGYHASAVHLDGTFWAKIASLSGIPDSPDITFSGWFQVTTDPNQLVGGGPTFFMQDGAGAGNFFGIASDGGGTSLKCGVEDQSYADYIGAVSAAGIWTFGAGWHHVFGYVSNNTLCKQYLDGVDVTGTITPGGGVANLVFNGTEFAFPDDNVADGNQILLTAGVADLMVYFGVLHTDVTVFRDATTHKPKDPATFPQGAIMLSGDHTTFLANTLGTAGALTTQAGSLTNASTSPSD
jgi:hypothetical protein